MKLRHVDILDCFNDTADTVADAVTQLKELVEMLEQIPQEAKAEEAGYYLGKLKESQN